MKNSAGYIFTLLLILASAILSPAQAPVGTISGTIYDQSGAVITNASITIRGKATGIERRVISEKDGNYSVASLAAGEYEVSAQASGFRKYIREVTVTTGTIVKVDVHMEVGQATEIVTVEAAGATQINYETGSVDGIISRQKIQELPLNGRSFLQLAFLEPGVTVSPGTTSQYNSLFSVAVLGGESNKTAITVDGGTIRNGIEGNTGMNFSQEVIQEFQLSSNNFDLSTGITSVGAINIVSRSGSNEFHGSGYYFFRDHNLSAYPGLAHDPLSPDPFFARRNPGFALGGPIVKNRLFFFTNYEYTNQTQVFTVQPDLNSIRGLAGNFQSPYSGHLFSLKLDWKLSEKHNLIARYSHDQNKGFGPASGIPLPSNWLQNTNFSDQSLLGVTSVLKPTLVNDFRFNYTYWKNRNLFADDQTCPGCLGLGFPNLTLVGSNENSFAVGNTTNATQGRDLRRFTFLDTLTWDKGSHRLRFGTELEYAPGTGFWGYCDPACAVAFSPEAVHSAISSQPLPVQAFILQTYFPNLPPVIRTNQDLLNLPFAGGVVGIGDPAQPPPYNLDKAKVNDRIRFFAQDTWKLKPRFALNYGLSWNFESTLVNRDLDKPKYLQPVYGSDLGPTKNNYNNFSPSLGFAWTLDQSNKTVVRGGGGIYWDTELLYRRLQERAFIGPLGNGRIQFPHSGFTNIFPGIVNFNDINPTTGLPNPVPVGGFLPSNALTNLTLGQFMQIQQAELASIMALLPQNLDDLSVRTIQLNKAGAQLYPHEYPVQHSYQMNLGIQRDLGHDLVASAYYVRRVFVNTLLGEVDYNRYNRRINGTQTPVIPLCAGQIQQADPNAECSTGEITFWTPGGRGVYNALLVKVDKRFSRRFQFTASYALTGQSGINTIDSTVVDLDNYFASYGPQSPRHILNVSALIDLPLGLRLGIISASSSRAPVMPRITNVDLDGDGTDTEPLPGVAYNCFNRGCGKSDLERAVQAWNAKYAGTRDARGASIPQLVLPPSYEFGDNFNSQDIRLTKRFTFGGNERFTLAVFGEIFNIFNIANLSGYNFDLNNATGAFGQPTQRIQQVFGSGGPRAIQIGGRFSF